MIGARWVTFAIMLLLAGAAATAYVWLAPTKGSAAFPPPPLAQTRFQNVAQDASYLGSDACLDCHQEQHASFMATTHSRALDHLDPADEPEDAEFFHSVSGRWYSVYRDNGQLRHRESIRTADGGETALADFAIDYVIGSGNHSRTYLFETDGFLLESPITWFSKPQAWGMSPGYEEDPEHPGFSRPVRYVCVFCHAGHVERIDGSIHRLKVHELAIGCERCHGPGSLHVNHRLSADTDDAADEDLTIVNPSRLARRQQDAVCGQCHLASAAQASVRGRELAQFRPGQRLSDYAVSYVLESDNQAMTVVGHVEQMRLSRCYTESDSMTCITCHDPHNTVAPEARVSFYRQRCLSCHHTESCALEESERLRRDRQDNCVGCHMPQSATDIPHFAFTHHRVGLYADSQFVQPQQNTRTAGTLVPLADLQHLSKIDQQRCLGLAYLQLSDETPDPHVGQQYRERAFTILQQVADQGLEDPEVRTALARRHWQSDPAESGRQAAAALALEGLSPTTRRDALTFLATSQFNLGDTPSAVETLNKLVRIEHRFEHWMMLSLCRQRQGDLAAALQAAERAVRIRPDRPDLRALAAQLCRQTGDLRRAEEHSKLAARLRNLRQQGD